MLLTAHASHSSTQQNNGRSFGSILVVTSAHVLVKEVNKSTWNKSTRNRNALNICLVFASLGKFDKINCPSYTQTKKKIFIGAISNKMLIVICDAGSPACIHKTLFKKNTVKHSVQSQLKQPAGRAHFQMHVPHYVTLWHRFTGVSDTVTTFIGQKSWKSIIAPL